MKLWLDAQFSPRLAPWIQAEFGLEAIPVRDVGHLRSSDREIFEAAREAEVIVMTKDADFVRLVEREGAPPQVLWVTCGNTSNQVLQRILRETMSEAIRLFQQGEPLVELSDAG